MKKLNNLSILKKQLHQTKEYQDYIKYRDLIKADLTLNDKLEQLNELSKRITNDKEFNLEHQYDLDKKEYDELYNDLSKNVLVLLYFNAKADLKQLFEEVFKIISDELNDIF